MIDRTALLADLKAEVRRLEKDLSERSASETEFATALKVEWQTAHDAKRTAGTYETWLDDRVTQAAVAWILATVFVRFCEDNDLIDLPYLAGPGERLAVAVERQQAFFQQHPEMTDRDWIVAGVEALAVSKVAAGLFDRAHNPMWAITPSHDAAKALLAFWRRRDANAKIVHDFTDRNWDTRFLGDLYQDLSEHAKKMYALLQTPEFVEEFILDYTLEPAVDEFGLDGLRLIDPTCGSGHFLLGAFRRLLTKWETRAPAVDRWELISRALRSVHGVDKNPFAVAIARFRLLVAAMRATNLELLSDAPNFSLNIGVGDSLLHGRGGPGIQTELALFGDHETHTYITEDIHEYEKAPVNILGINSYHIVVGNPPYITPRDKQENDNYRKAYASCHREYSLSVPFAERFFQLAIRGGQNGQGAGYVGQITANSFMKREFGKKLVKEFFPTVDLTHVVDLSGAYIPGHGTPTVILIGRRRWPKIPAVRAVRSVNGEPGVPLNPPRALVWSAIVDQINVAGSESRWVSVDDLGRRRYFERHPWVLEAGGLELVEKLQEVCEWRVSDLVLRIGYFGDSHADDIFLTEAPRRISEKAQVLFARPLHQGKQIRNWVETGDVLAIVPYDQNKDPLSEERLTREFVTLFWPYRTELWKRQHFTGETYFKAGRKWWEWHQLPKDASAHIWVVVFADLATHNHFVLDRHGDAFNRHAPVIKFPQAASENDFMKLLATLNSSTACYWLKRVSHDRGVGGIGGGIGDEDWEPRYEFTGANLGKYPIVSDLSLVLGQELDGLASRLNAVEPSAVCAKSVPTRAALDAAQAEHAHIRARMVALQEELDWDIYHRYGLLDDTEANDLTADPARVPELSLGERAFEIILAGRIAAHEVDTQWFARHGSVPIEVIPREWPEPYRTVVAKRIEMIENRRDIALIERPECKRRWQSEPWEKKERAALRTWLLDRCEDRTLWFEDDGQGRAQPRPMTVNRLADKLRKDAAVVSVARLLAGPDADLAEVVTEITADEHVPCLAQQRYKEPGLRKRRQWERVWDLQREEDRDNVRLDIDVPPKYTNADFLRMSYWRNRGKLDVPKERFVSYPGASPDGDNSLLLGWAGWDHREQAHALMTLIDERATRDGWDGGRLKPLIAALAEVMPWVRQWHSDVDPEFGTSPAKAYDAFLDEQKLTYGFGSDDLDRWRPPKTSRGRRSAKPASADVAAVEPDEPQDEAPGEDEATL